MKQVQKGFTLIELVIVMVVLGILAAVAIPQFADLSTQAGTAAGDGGKTSVASAISIEAAIAKGTPTGDAVASRVGGTCSSGVVSIGKVNVTLAPAACTTGTTGVGAASYST